MDSSNVYETRNNLLTLPVRWEIKEEGINLTQSSGVNLIKWDNIREIRLQYAPARYIANRYTCAVNLNSGGRFGFRVIIIKISMTFEMMAWPMPNLLQN